jgi:hypothetical protein
MPDVLAAAAGRLRAGKEGRRHATLGIVGARFDAEAARRRGSKRDAIDAAEHARAAARAFGHVWHELGALRTLNSLMPAPVHRDRAATLLHAIEDGLASEDERVRVRAQWQV